MYNSDKKLEGSQSQIGSLKVQLINLFQNIDELRNQKNYFKTLKIYDQILNIHPENSRAPKEREQILSQFLKSEIENYIEINNSHIKGIIDHKKEDREELLSKKNKFDELGMVEESTEVHYTITAIEKEIKTYESKLYSKRNFDRPTLENSFELCNFWTTFDNNEIKKTYINEIREKIYKKNGQELNDIINIFPFNLDCLHLANRWVGQYIIDNIVYDFGNNVEATYRINKINDFQHRNFTRLKGIPPTIQYDDGIRKKLSAKKIKFNKKVYSSKLAKEYHHFRERLGRKYYVNSDFPDTKEIIIGIKKIISTEAFNKFVSGEKDNIHENEFKNILNIISTNDPIKFIDMYVDYTKTKKDITTLNFLNFIREKWGEKNILKGSRKSIGDSLKKRTELVKRLYDDKYYNLSFQCQEDWDEYYELFNDILTGISDFTHNFYSIASWLQSNAGESRENSLMYVAKMKGSRNIFHRYSGSFFFHIFLARRKMKEILKEYGEDINIDLENLSSDILWCSSKIGAVYRELEMKIIDNSLIAAEITNREYPDHRALHCYSSV